MRCRVGTGVGREWRRTPRLIHCTALYTRVTRTLCTTQCEWRRRKMIRSVVTRMYEGLSVFYGRTCDVNEETGEREGSDACCVVMRAGGSAGVGERGKKQKREVKTTEISAEIAAEVIERGRRLDKIVLTPTPCHRTCPHRPHRRRRGGRRFLPKACSATGCR